MAKETLTKLDALIFIDTNIFLDFYRIRRSDVSMKYLKEIENNIDLIITTNQVEMEFKKNRQKVILEAIGEIKKNVQINTAVPACLSDTKIVEMIKKSKKGIDGQQKKLKQTIEKILKQPSYTDPVYKSLQKLFRHKSEINLDRENPIRYSIRKLALKRFILDYPPRKSTDNSIGDAINWEWIIKCANDTGKNIILVTRDTDYGADYEGELYLNDWLSQEFKERVSRRKKLILTDKLSKAFDYVNIHVTKDMIEEEQNIIDQSIFNNQFRAIQESLSSVQETMRLADYTNVFKDLRAALKARNDLFKNSFDPGIINPSDNNPIN